MRFLFIVALLLGAALLAGCTGGDDVDPADGGDGSGGGPGSGTDDPVLSGQEPAQWAVGHAWTYDSDFGTTTFVVSGEEGSDWIVDTPSVDTAWFNVRSPISFLDQVRKDDLAGSQRDDRVQFFDFPLEEGKEWTTTWDGRTRDIVTVEANESFRFEAYQDEALVVAYDYDPEVGWFTFMEFYDNQTGELQVAMELSDQETGWTGEIVRWDATMRVGMTSTFNPVGSYSGSFGASGHEELWGRVWYRCPEDAQTTSMLFVLTPLPPDGTETVMNEECMDEEEILLFQEPAEEYHFQASSHSVGTPGTLVVEFWSRTLETHTVG